MAEIGGIAVIDFGGKRVFPGKGVSECIDG